MTGTDLLAIAEAVSTQIALADDLDFVLPSPFKFRDKADFFASISDEDSKDEIETTLIRAAWLKYLRFEDDDRDKDGAIRTLIYEATVFHESTFERLDETVTPDDFNQQIRKTNHEHVTALMGIVDNMQAVNSLPSLAPSVFEVAETNTPAQIDNTATDVPCDFIPGVIGDQSRLEIRVRVQLPC